jgi:hypothetical protein
MRFAVWYARQRFSIGRSRHSTTVGQGSCVPTILGYNRSGEWRVFCYQYGGETKDGPLPVSDEGIWRCLSLRKLSSVECVTGPWRTEPHAPQRCVEHIEVDADDYPGGDPQNGQ